MLCCFVFLLEVVVEIRESQSVRGIEPPEMILKMKELRRMGWPVDVENDPQLTNSMDVGP